MLTKLLQGNSGVTSLTVAGDVAVKQHKTYHDSLPKGAGYQLRWTFDYEEVSREDLIRLATETLCISLRPKFKHFGFDEEGRFVANDEQLAEWDGITWNVSDILAKRKDRSPRIATREKVKRAIHGEVHTFTKLQKLEYALENGIISQDQFDMMAADLPAE